MRSLMIRGRLIAGFAAICLVLAAAVGFSLWRVSGIRDVTDRLVDLRAPTALTGRELVADLEASLAELRGYLLTGNPALKTSWAGAITRLGAAQTAMDRLAAGWTSAENKAAWQDAKKWLAELQAAQERVAAVYGTSEDQPGIALLNGEAAPLSATMFDQISAMINDEANQPATSERRTLLTAMADFRGSLSMGMANLRAFLLSGDPKLKGDFEQLWKQNGDRFQRLTAARNDLSAAQRSAFAALAAARGTFEPLPQRLFEIRASDRWNLSLALLRNEALPRASAVLDVLEGQPAADGARAGGLIDRQVALLSAEAGVMKNDADGLATALWGLLGGGLVLAGLIVFFTQRSIVPPVTAMTGAMTALADGRLEVEIPARGNRDEIGAMAKAVQVFKDNAIRVRQMQAEQEQLKQRAEADKKAALGKMADAFESSVKGMVNTVSAAATELQTASATMSATAEEASRQSTAVAAASEQASTNVQTVASATEELSSSVQEIARQVAESTKISGNAVDEARQTNVAVEGLSAAAAKIGDVVKLISDIASQTNLLALNATIEAARAGEAGKGFAVVAAEVKSLANQTAKATEEIGQQIGAIQAATERSVSAIKGIGTTIEQISQIATTIASAVEEQGAATQEIARNIQEASKGTQEVSSNIVSVTKAAGETGAAAAQVRFSASELAQSSEMMRTQVDEFLANIRAA